MATASINAIVGARHGERGARTKTVPRRLGQVTLVVLPAASRRATATGLLVNVTLAGAPSAAAAAAVAGGLTGNSINAALQVLAWGSPPPQQKTLGRRSRAGGVSRGSKERL